MAHVCLHADECRVFIKNGKLKFQARKVGQNEAVHEQVTISFPVEMACYFTQVADLDVSGIRCFGLLGNNNRLKDLMNDE